MDSFEFIPKVDIKALSFAKDTANPKQKRPLYQRYPKPPYSYVGLIATAILTSPEKMLTLTEIHTCLKMMFDFFAQEYTGWKDSVRHNLSHSKCFSRRENITSNGTKAGYWTVEVTLLPINCFTRQNTNVSLTSHYALQLHDELGIPQIHLPHQRPCSSASTSSSISTTSSSYYDNIVSPFSDISEPTTPDNPDAVESFNFYRLPNSPTPSSLTPVAKLRETDGMTREVPCLSDASPSPAKPVIKAPTKRKVKRLRKTKKDVSAKTDLAAPRKYEQLRQLVTESAVNWGVSTESAIDNLRMLCIGIDSSISNGQSQFHHPQPGYATESSEHPHINVDVRPLPHEMPQYDESLPESDCYSEPQEFPSFPAFEKLQYKSDTTDSPVPMEVETHNLGDNPFAIFCENAYSNTNQEPMMEDTGIIDVTESILDSSPNPLDYFASFALLYGNHLTTDIE